MVADLWAIRSELFGIVEKKIEKQKTNRHTQFPVFTIFITKKGLNGSKGVKCYSSYKSQSKAFTHLLNFLLNGSHNTTFRILKF